MKYRILALFSVLLLILVLFGCGGNTNSPSLPLQKTAGDNEADGRMPTVVNTAEYVLYQNIFRNGAKADYNGQETVKRGTFATIYDAFNEVTRYYVWGYNDQTKCCDWQWELKIDDEADIPLNGSLVKASGTYEENEAALDKFWIVDPEITVEKEFPGRDVDIDMLSLDNTLERVQTINIVRKAEAFEGKSVCGYGRIQNENTLEDPYYNNSWTIGISGDFELPAFGTLVLVSGTIRDGSIADCKIMSNTQY